MTDITTWHCGIDNYRRHSLIVDQNQVELVTEITDVEHQSGRCVTDIIGDILKTRQTKTVEVLYSGGLDSELVMYACLVNKIPVTAITMRLLADGVAFNTHDLYYAEKFCRQNSVPHQILDLDVKKFCEHGDHYSYLEPYYIRRAHVATHFWLLEQCTGFPVLGGDYTWPWTHGNESVVSPLRLDYAQYERFFQDRGIHGIGNMLNHSLELNLTMTRAHIDLYKSNTCYGTQGIGMSRFKHDLFKMLGYESEMRFRSYGFETLDPKEFDIDYYNKDLAKRYGKNIVSTIVWQQALANVLGGDPGRNSRFTPE